ncbi:MAG TPA: GNAT family N-acetyltransferase [Nitrospira sp.]|nr:GNAT family N-acetyltransferase [Nitrospira sp.]
MQPTFRPGTVRDAAACGQIGYEAFKAIAEQHGFPPDFPSADRAVGLLSQILTRPDVYSVVAELDGQVVGSNFLWEGDTIAGVGPITVASTAQNAGLGRMLMKSVLDRANARRQAGVRLVQAAYHNRSLSLYTKLGFQAREPLSTLQGLPLKMELPGYRVRQATLDDLALCDALCRGVYGCDRRGEIAHAIADGTATVVEHNGRITGYTTGLGFFGHAVGRTNDELKALIGAAPAFTGLGFLLPTRNMELLRWCLNHGLRIVQPMTLMSLGLYQKPACSFLPSILY